MSNPWDEVAAPRDDINVRRADPSHPFDFFWGKDTAGRYLFLFQTSTRSKLPSQMPEIKGIDISVFHSDMDRMVITLREKIDWEMFLALCRDLMFATSSLHSEESVVPVILRRLTRWQQLLSRGVKDLLTEAEIKGLIGELVFLEKYLEPAFGISDAVRFWLGPEGAPQDFNVGDAAIEVKCQSGSSTPCIRISSLEQLSPQLPEMYLYVVTLGKAARDAHESIDLLSLISEIRDRISIDAPGSLERFNDLLHSCGYMDKEAYAEYAYILSADMMFNVIDDFPRIASDAVPGGVTKVSYSISLDQCLPYLGGPSWYAGEQK
ncbi:PD-(D/E)XK motif protein [Mariprofundus ferrooxydans]|uniref:PD-(D/E)XK motif protein n=1 Tax=Mariprofundus ferrooxydans TaxID=314344 RepID=UPI00142FD393|nr:PD-(D/E)XK motif protein [Mariprofundus ferrooxydans]